MYTSRRLSFPFLSSSAHSLKDTFTPTHSHTHTHTHTYKVHWGHSLQRLFEPHSLYIIVCCSLAAHIAISTTTTTTTTRGSSSSSSSSPVRPLLKLICSVTVHAPVPSNFISCTLAFIRLCAPPCFICSLFKSNLNFLALFNSHSLSLSLSLIVYIYVRHQLCGTRCVCVCVCVSVGVDWN